MEVRTLVLVGRSGNGISATGNTILGSEQFVSCPSSSRITTSCVLRTTDDQLINVIDTPGMFQRCTTRLGSDFVVKEIVNFFNLVKDCAIDAIILVFSVRSRFSHDDEASLRSLQLFFGSNIVDYIIIVFTGGDEIDESLEDYLLRGCPQSLKDVLALCKNRCLLFDNKTEDELKRVKQVEQLLSLVNGVVMQNGGQSPDLFTKFKEGAMKLGDHSLKGYSKQEISDLKTITEMVESKLRQLEEEQTARFKAQENAQQVQLNNHCAIL